MSSYRDPEDMRRLLSSSCSDCLERGIILALTDPKYHAESKSIRKQLRGLFRLHAHMGLVPGTTKRAYAYFIEFPLLTNGVYTPGISDEDTDLAAAVTKAADLLKRIYGDRKL